jgi:hypothetical protein
MFLLAACAGGGAGASSGTGGSGGAASRDCAGTTCSDTDVCVAYRTLGGGIIEPDANGDCQTGSHPEPASFADSGMYCVANFAYRCVPLSGCLRGAPVNCECAMLNIADTGGTCPTGYSSCTDPAPNTPGLDADAQLICQQLAP